MDLEQNILNGMEKGKFKGLFSSLQQEYDIDILGAREFGSRAWNLDSESSDRDIGIVFSQDIGDYVKVGEYRQNISRNLAVDGEELNVMGWNVKRFASLLCSSNPTVIEWLNSDERYIQTPVGTGTHVDVFGDLRDHANENFRPIAMMGHYHDLAKSNYKKYLEDGSDTSVKRNLYVLRALLYKEYVASTHSMPPLDFMRFVEAYWGELDETLLDDFHEDVTNLAVMKRNGEGDKDIGVFHEEFITKKLDEMSDKEEHNVRGIDKEFVNEKIMEVFPQRTPSSDRNHLNPADFEEETYYVSGN